MGTGARRVPWDVLVQLVTNAAPGVRSTRPVDIGLTLPGIVGVIATTSTVDGRTLLSAIRPSDEAASQRPVPLREFLAGLEVDGAVPVLVEGTPFRMAVLAALAGVAAGASCTYADLAVRAGRPRAVRAAAHVMATNLVPLVLPCHRVVPSGGGTGRYGWGDATKPVLLDAERRAAV